ncbi:MAG: hypothetical protein GTO17_05110 [Candidatus Aminicenantes bacterium]|nr:hypothetical protein [Candidatus Aminicenantes bacterium]
MKKQILILVLFIFMLSAGWVQGQGLKSGEAAIFLQNGGKVSGEIVDISSRRMVLELKDGSKIKLSNIWMINCVNMQYYFPQERNQIQTPQHYFFLKNGNITSGKLIDFSSKRKVFELDTGEKIAYGTVKRLYFTKKVPAKFGKPVKVKKPIKVKKPVKIKKEVKS